MPGPRRWAVCGVDFTSRPSSRKSITIAAGYFRHRGFILESIEDHQSWEGFEAWLHRPGPWIAGFDFPFGLPRCAVQDLQLPNDYVSLVHHCRRLGRDAFRALLDRYRESRPAGSRYAHRVTDLPARSHSPLKLVNPPVGLMFLEGVPRLLDAGVRIPGLAEGDPERLAFEGYPGFTARAIFSGSYKNDSIAKQTPARRRARKFIVETLMAAKNPFGIALIAPPRLLASLVNDATGDRLDAVICAMQAGWALQRHQENYGLPRGIDPLEGWILMVPEAQTH
ncbi:MAG TPA: DUF429 domain-containing protein [Burkholderiales bacterium]